VRVGIFAGLNGPVTFEQALEGAQEAERHGFASCWLPNIFGLDALTALAGIGPQTQRIELGTNVVTIQPWHPLALPQQALRSVRARSRTG
jgi:5,10-methylenetetrahydromethanopterin reductase